MAFAVIDKLVKNYGSNCAVDNLSFKVNEGEIFGLIGPNGAGKSTTINIITTLDEKTSGSVTIDGMDITKDREKIRRIIGSVPQEIAVYPYLTARENVEFFAALYGLKGKKLHESAEKALEFAGLLDKADMKPKKMSGGMKRRLNIACGIAHEPKLIVMDEPTVGVDAQSREHIMNSIKKLRENGATIIYTSHYMHEVEEICDRVAIVDKGRLVAEGTQQELITMIADSCTVKIDTKLNGNVTENELVKAISSLPDVTKVKFEDNTLSVDMNISCSDISHVISELVRLGLPVLEVNTERPDMDAVFLSLTGHEIR
ncbi:MAG: ABC transporter ATP-binding protein [Ruminiclostridium sp.]